MSMPISRLFFFSAAALLLASCSGRSGDEALKEAEKEATQQAIADGKIECALGGAKDFQRVCTTERTSTENGQLLTIRHPNGGFKSFRVLTDGRGLEPAHGFDADFDIKVMDDGMIELRSANDLYRLPAKIKADTPSSPKAE